MRFLQNAYHRYMYAEANEMCPNTNSLVQIWLEWNSHYYIHLIHYWKKLSNPSIDKEQPTHGHTLWIKSLEWINFWSQIHNNNLLQWFLVWGNCVIHSTLSSLNIRLNWNHFTVTLTSAVAHCADFFLILKITIHIKENR